MSPLFLAVIEAAEVAVYNSLLRATTITGRGHTVEALPIEKTTGTLKQYGSVSCVRVRLRWQTAELLLE